MARFVKFKDLVQIGRNKGPGFAISRSFYLSVLANTSVLPPLLAIVNPKAEGGAAGGFGVPLRFGAKKDELAEPLIRGFYGMATPDQKTVLKLAVIGKEEAGFDPDPMLRSPAGQKLDPEVRTRIAAAWNLMQVTFESYHPSVYPALDFLMAVVVRMAELTDGVVADPICQAYRLPSDIRLDHDEGLPFAASVHVAVRELPRGPLVHLSTLGLSKFGLPEVEIDGVEPSAAAAGRTLLMGVAQSFLRGRPVEPGDRLGARGAQFRAAEGGLDRSLWDGIPCIELIPEAAGQTSANLKAWHEEQLGKS